MSHIELHADDPRLTAYALGELDPTEQETIERLLAESPEAQNSVREIRELAGLLATELQHEPAPALTTAQRNAILAGNVSPVAPRAATSRRTGNRWISQFAALASMAALVAVAAFLPAPGNRSSGDRSSGYFLGETNGDGLARDNWSLALQQSEGIRDFEGLNEDAVTFSPDGRRLSATSSVSTGRPGHRFGETGVTKALTDGTSDLTAIDESLVTGLERPAASRAQQSGDKSDRSAGEGEARFKDYRGGQGQPDVQHKELLAKEKKLDGATPVASDKGSSESKPQTAPQFEAGSKQATVMMRDGSVKYNMPVGSSGKHDKPGQAAGTSTEASKPIRRGSFAGGVPGGLGGAGNGGGAGWKRPVPGGGTVPLAEDEAPRSPGSGAVAGLATSDDVGKKTEREWRESRRKEISDHAESFFFSAIDATPGTEAYEPIVENLFRSSYEDPLSTFGIDVDTASYANVRRFLTQHQLPPRNAVRIEELVNYFSYDYPQPADDRPFSVTVEAGRCPWSPANGLVKIGLKGRDIDRDKRPASNLVFLVDVSGSMQAENKLPLVKMGLNLLTQQMTETDKVAIVTYSDTAVQRLESTNGSNKGAINGVIDSLHAGGSTNGAGGIQLAYRAAVQNFIPGGTNRVILCTDGDFNVGTTDDDQLVKLIQDQARTKVFFSVLGFGMGNLKDGKLEKLADKGNGQYAYIDSQNEARKVFVDDIAGTLVTIAKDVKLQVEFNPNQVSAYRLIGYENRVMAAQDFNNDAKDAGDIGAGHTVTALYETLPAAEAPRPLLGDTLRYRNVVVPKDGALAGELLTVKLRYKLPEADTSTLVEVPISVPVKNVAVTGAGDSATSLTVQLRAWSAPAAAKSLRELFGTDKDKVPTIEADESHRQLRVAGTPEQLSQVRRLLADLGEGGNASSRDFNWAAAVAAFGMILRDSQFRGQANFDMVLELAQGALGEDKVGRRKEFIELVKTAKALRSGIVPAADAPTATQPVVQLTREQAEAKASAGGKYVNLLRIVESPEDAATYGEFHDYGHWDGTAYAGQNDLPKGYWVYVSPRWYIWGDEAKRDK
jgi:Ca-activated chloride channel family protein